MRRRRRPAGGRQRRDLARRRSLSRRRTSSRPPRDRGDGVGSMPPSTSSATPSPRMWRSRSILSSECSMNCLSGPAGVDGHAQRQIDRVAISATRADRGGGVDRDADTRAALTHETRRVGDMRRGLGMESDRMGTGLAGTPGSCARDARSSGARRARPRPARPARAAKPTTIGPSVIDGTKCPSMTSTWMTRAPAASTSSTCAPSRAKSAERIDGATRTSRRRSPL